MPTAELDDVELYYEINGEGTPLVMITGFSENLDVWDILVPSVASLSKCFKVVTLDNRGTGRSSKPDGPYSIRTMADDVANLLDYLSIGKANVLGVSMGGMIAQEVGINHPKNVEKLVLVCTSPGGSKWYDFPGQREAFKKLEWYFNPPPNMTESQLMDEVLRLVFYPKFLEEELDKIMSISTEYPTVAATLEKQYEACLEHDTFNRLDLIRAKTLVIHGEDDLLLFSYGARLLSNRIPYARLLMVNEAGHCVLEEKWEDIYPDLLQFLYKGNG
jgi:pimeloyl-ACP methyl ester carboxylesterase